MRVQNLGPIKDCELTLGQQTMFMGKNNTGKTYISYLYYGIFKKLNELRGELLDAYVTENFDNHTDGLTFTISRKMLMDYLIKHCTVRLNTDIYSLLPRLFNLNEFKFKQTNITIEESDVMSFLKSFDRLQIPFTSQIVSVPYVVKVETEEKDGLIIIKLNDIEHMRKSMKHTEIIDDYSIAQAFQNSVINILITKLFYVSSILYIPAERNGINVFKKELTFHRSLDSFDIDEDSRQAEIYPTPISDYIRYLNTIDREEDFNGLYGFDEENMDQLQKNIWFLFSTTILNGKYEYDSNANEYYYCEFDSISPNHFNDIATKHKYKDDRIALQHASSSVKSLFGLEFYLKHKVSAGDILFIDEPEMNLDPMRQIKFAELISKLSQSGVRVIISSHSDYLIRATTNQMLKAQLDNEKKWSAMGYYFDQGTVTPLPNLADMDYIEIFDNANRELDDAYFNLRDRLLSQNEHSEHSNKV